MKALQASQYIGLLPGSPSELQILQWSPSWLKLYQYNRTTRTTHHTPPWPQVLDCNSNLLSGFSLCSAGTGRREPWERGCTNGKSLKSGGVGRGKHGRHGRCHETIVSYQEKLWVHNCTEWCNFWSEIHTPNT